MAPTNDRAEHMRLEQTVERLEREIARHRATVEQLRTTRSTMQAILELTDASVFAKDLDGRYLLVNPKGAEIVGLTPDEVIGRTDEELYGAEQAERFQAHIDDVVATGRPVTTMMPIDRSGVQEVWLSHVVPLMDDRGRIYGTAGIATDVTERAKQDELLQRRTRELEAAQRIARLGTWSWDPDTDRVEISDELTRILGGASGQRWSLSDLEAVTDPDDLAAAVRAVRTARSGHDVDHLFRIRLADGSTRWLRLLSEAGAHADATANLVIGTIQDVTEREEAEHRRASLERRLQQSQRLETVGQLAGGVAHDFNNLLAVIGMQAELARQSLDSHHPAAEQLDELTRTVERASALTRQLLVFSRHEGYDHTVIDLASSLDALGPLLARSLGTHIEMVVDLEAGLHHVQADRSQIEQVLVNLAVNARDAMPDGGRLTIAGRNETTPDGSIIRLSVTDTGVGMGPETVDRAFEPFFTTKPAGVGTGLGLPTVHGIITRSGGTVDIRSELGRGTSVDIVLPAVTGATAAAPPAVVTDGAAGTSDGTAARERTVLIVEDLEPLGKLAATILARGGYRTVVATRGHEALDLVDDGCEVDLLLTDVVMPAMTGRELADRLHERRPGVPVIFMTGYTGGMLELGDHEHAVVLSKPFTGQELIAVVAAAFADST